MLRFSVMVRKRVPYVIVARYTTLVQGTYRFAIADVSSFELGRFLVWRGSLIGSSPSFSMYFEESSDLVEWVACNGVPSPYDPGAQGEETVEIPFRRKHFRLRVDVGGNDAMCTFFTYGYMLARSGVLL